MRKICPKCKGNGYHKEPIDTTLFAVAPLTLGLSLFAAFIRKDVKCKICDGKGYLED